MSAIEDTVCAKILARANVGLQTYGKGMDRKDLTRLQWLEHWQQESMDAAIYAQKLIEEEKERVVSDYKE